jgi:hypothetical protein
MTHEEKAIAYAHAGRLRDQLRDSETDLIRIATMQDNLTFLREGIIRRRVGWTQELDTLKSQIEQPE